MPHAATATAARAEPAAIPLEDRLALMETQARFDWATDAGDVEAWLAQCAEDVVFEASYGEARGKAAVRDLLTRMETGFSRGKRHLAGNHVFELAGAGEVLLRSYLVVFERERGAHVVATATTTDRYRRDEDGRWRLHHRRVEVDPGMRAEHRPPPG